MASDYKTMSLPFHYGWVIVGTGTLCIFACLGFGRFALGMLLPSMAGPLNLSYSQMGFISTANFIGYLIAVLLGGIIALRTGARKLIFASLLLVSVSMLLISQAKKFRTSARTLYLDRNGQRGFERSYDGPCVYVVFEE